MSKAEVPLDRRMAFVRNARYHAHHLQPEPIHAHVLVGPDAYVLDALARLMPSRYFDLLARLERLRWRLR